MARGESPYQGRYTVPIHDYSPIERGGAAWGQAFANVGGAIGAGIEKYGLKKEEDKKTKGSIKNAVSIIDDLILDEPDQSLKDQYTIQREQLLDEETPLGTRGEQARLLRETIGIRSQLKQRQALTQATTMANEFAEDTKSLRLELKASEVENERLTTTGLNIQNILKELTLDSTAENIRLGHEKLRAEIGLVPLRKKQLKADVDKTKAETTKLTSEAGGKGKITYLTYPDPADPTKTITDKTHGYGEGNTLLYKEEQPDGKVRWRTIGTSESAQEAKIAARVWHDDAMKLVGKEFAFTAKEGKDQFAWFTDPADISIATLSMILERHTEEDVQKDGTISFSWEAADGTDFDVDNIKTLEQMEKGNAKDRERAEKINAYRRHREEIWKFPEPQSGPDENKDKSDDEVRRIIRGM